MSSVPAKGKVRWLWRGDDGWHEYDQKLADQIEAAFQKDEKKYKVDDERFVDLEDFLQRYGTSRNLPRPSFYYIVASLFNNN